MTVTTKDLQTQLDTRKWFDSEKKHADTCGEYDFCAYCKITEEYPCAVAYETYLTKMKKPEAPKKAEAAPVAKKPAAKKPAAKKAPVKKA